MFEIGDVVVYGANGICRIQAVTTLQLPYAPAYLQQIVE